MIGLQGNLVFYRRVVEARLGHGWGTNLEFRGHGWSKLGASLGHGWGTGHDSAMVGAGWAMAGASTLGARLGQGWGKVGARSSK